MKTSFPTYKQAESKDCGPTCIKMIAKFYGKLISTQELRELSETTREGSSLLGLSKAFESVGFRALSVKLNFNELKEAHQPCVLHWNNNHFVVLYKISGKHLYIADPAHGQIRLNKQEFLELWSPNKTAPNNDHGIALLVEPTSTFYNREFIEEPKFGFGFVFKYVLQYKKFLFQLIIGLAIGSLIQLAFPFLTQSIVDKGIKNKDIGFVYLVLAAQLFLFLGRTTVDIFRSWILLKLSTRINIAMVSDFFAKLMNLPISYFDVRLTGDLMQRIQDHKRLENVFTTSSLTTAFSFFNLIVFGFVLAYYSMKIFGIFLVGSLCYVLWVLFFFKKRAALDYKRFAEVSVEQSKVIELINGMQEIKLHNAEQRMRSRWEQVQLRIFKVALKSLSLEQTQSVGSSVINELKNMLITVVAATLVINDQLTLGMMLAISYIVGQLNAPIGQAISFLRNLQDAKISLDRLAEIHNMEDEEPPNEQRITKLPKDRSIHIKNLGFRYPGNNEALFKDLELRIPANKVTAIVGTSGSGKTTLMKLLLHFYKPQKGQILVGSAPLEGISQTTWRRHIGVVMQEGYIFNDTIAANIAIGQDEADEPRLQYAAKLANIQDFIQSLPLGFNTEIGNEGLGLSTGQKQRLLIARAVYKNPDYLFFDEATSALDAKNEKEINDQLNDFLKDRTAVVIAHRISTVKNAHQIVVLDQGCIVELGSHKELVKQRGQYFQLVKNQLELAN